MKFLFTLLAGIALSPSLFSQYMISGKVRDAATGMGLPGVSIIETGSKSSALTDSTGTYSISVSIENAQLVFSYVGYDPLEIKAGDKTVVNVSLTLTDVLLNEVVVTALGIQRDRKELGYAVQTLKGAALTEVRQPNVVNALAGRIAGVQITNGSSGVGSSSRIVIRGENSLTGTNQPLFVVDGVPITNNTITNNTENNETGFQEVDYGNGAADINPDDIESVTVLKGAGATALYGSRAAGGVVVIKTKDGSSASGRGISFNSSVTWEKYFPEICLFI